MFPKILLALSGLILLSSCVKRDESHLNKKCTSGCAIFNVRVGSGERSAIPVSGAHVNLVWQAPHGILGGGGKSIDIAKGYTDVNGMINMKFKAFGNEFTDGYFIINVTGSVNYMASSRPLFSIHNPDTILNTSVHLPALAYLKIVFKNYVPTDSGDFFGAMPSYDTYGSEPFLNSPVIINYHNTTFFSGLQPFDSLTYIGNTAGDQYTHLAFALRRNGIKITHLDSVYIPRGTTGTYRVDYQHSFQ
jgi:hypothetical protein